MAVEDSISASPGEQSRYQSLRHNLCTVALAATVITLSVALIHLNNYLMHETRFPHAVPLVLIHMVFCSAFSCLLFLLKPSLFPSLASPQCVSRLELIKKCMPIAVIATCSLVLGNMAYTYISVAFIQMIKETNIVWVYLLSLTAGLEVLGLAQFQVIFLALTGMTLTLRGELHFSVIGFTMQFAALLCDCARIVLQGALLSDVGVKLDSLSYVLLVCPLCGACLVSLIWVTALFPSHLVSQGLQLPGIGELRSWWPLLLCSAMIAFCLNVSIASLIKRTSPMSYIICQLMKDIFAVFVGVRYVHEVVSPSQYAGFSLQILAAICWALLRNLPDKVGNGLISGIYALVSGAYPRAASIESHLPVKKFPVYS